MYIGCVYSLGVLIASLAGYSLLAVNQEALPRDELS